MMPASKRVSSFSPSLKELRGRKTTFEKGVSLTSLTDFFWKEPEELVRDYWTGVSIP